MRQQFPEDFIPPVVTTIVLSIFGVLSGINLLAFIYAFFNRRYPPIKAKQINLVAFYFLASVIWCIGLLQVYGFFGFEGIWQYCVLWRIWLKDVFGLGMILGFINFRFYSLYVVFVCGRSFADAPKLLPAVCYVAPYLSLAMVSMLRSDNVIQEKPGHFCSLKEWYGIAFMLVVGLSLLLAFYQCYLLRNISRSFNEYKTQVIGLSMIIFTYAVNLAFMKRPLPYMLEVKVGMFIMNLLTATIYIWLMIGSPIIGSLFYRQSYLEKFVSNLMADNAGVLSAKAVM
ncbi:hypothetical protein BDF19DRAFT_412839 [Syncephalis fuscata]|nr:hypothetical protein BDF19DRAFT_412839 [Syncephalis fuscata]